MSRRNRLRLRPDTIVLSGRGFRPLQVAATEANREAVASQ
jgi:hypothetical protein